MIANRLLKIAESRAPDFVIGGATDPYLRRWWVIPRNRFFNVYLHHFMRSDDDRALHDHPWLFNVSWLLKGDYLEVTPGRPKFRREGCFKFRWGKSPHRVQLTDSDVGAVRESPVWTLFITGPRVREWGFYCPNGWRHWKLFTSNNGATVGRGCE